MSFWQVTMKRSTGLSKSYIILGVFLTIYGVILSNLMSIIPPDLIIPGPIDLSNNFLKPSSSLSQGNTLDL